MGGASLTPALRVASAKASIAAAWTVTSDEPPSTATCTSEPDMRPRPGGDTIVSTSPGTPKTE